MPNQLENLCGEKGLKVEFINYSFIEGADVSKNDQPVIKVHKIFKECPIRVATAIVEIFTGEGYTCECIEIIESYLKEKFGPVGIKVKTPANLIKPVKKEMKSNTPCELMKENYYSREEDHFNKTEQYIEADIFSMDVINMKGKQEKINGNDSLFLNEQDVLELDIVISPPLHK